MNGFELDHKTMVSKDGSNDDDNLQILCSGNNGCHAKKTAKDMGWRKQGGCDVNGNPLNADHRWTAGIPPPPRQSSRG